MRERGAPLKLRDGEPVLGRFFANGCNSQVIDDESRKSFIVQYSGSGYGWTNLTQRLAFESSGLVEYAPDFQLQNGAMYIYFRPVNVASALLPDPRRRVGTLAQTGIAVTGAANPDQLGRDIVDGELKRGFTVIRYGSNGETDFGMGVVAVGEKALPPLPRPERRQGHPRRRPDRGALEPAGPRRWTHRSRRRQGPLSDDAGGRSARRGRLPGRQGRRRQDRRSAGPHPRVRPPSPPLRSSCRPSRPGRGGSRSSRFRRALITCSSTTARPSVRPRPLPSRATTERPASTTSSRWGTSPASPWPFPASSRRLGAPVRTVAR